VRWGLRLSRWLDSRQELPDNLNSILGALRVLGHNRLREGQLDVILAALRGESVLVVRPTEAGKSLCFQLPTLMRPGGALVLSPLKALMQDQISDLQERKVPASFINSDITRKEKSARFYLWEHSGLKFLYCAPERFDAKKIVNPAEIDRLAKIKPNYLVVDEAHCVR
jgi:ATP-dependent DNA helicase RecQ